MALIARLSFWQYQARNTEVKALKYLEQDIL
ncbi:MAG: hypothetical protein JKX73_11440 [Flavobacteriales bacterium]|nr:hypothetical protein [Flavobacteriales bacterium]